ncbi:MAG: hypothetical protein JWO23_713 [Solirubrobacterales bacterium]|jgi:hypothetical protein|nr:hypothetical protein [Solirubrobacterales bacterium]MCW3024979.1 hypothetical protein [Solirubrobacterales bacterium]
MTLSVAIAINAVAMFTLMGLLAHVMSRPAQLKPHGPRDAVPGVVAVAPRRVTEARRARRSPAVASLGS